MEMESCWALQRHGCVHVRLGTWSKIGQWACIKVQAGGIFSHNSLCSFALQVILLPQMMQSMNQHHSPSCESFEG